MVVYFLGIPGSGKSNYGVNVIFNNFSDDKEAVKDLKKDYINCYTNINEFRFDKVHNVYKLDFEELYEHLKELHKLYKKKATDEELIEKAKEYNIYKTLFIVDECHNYFDANDTVLVWWLTYHRHLFHDIYLITQNLSLLHSNYKKIAEAFYKAKSNSLTLDKRYFQYLYYVDSRMTKGSYVSTIKLKKNPKVFELYKSGDSVKSKNVIAHFLKISLVLLILLVTFAYFYVKSKFPDEEQESSVKVVSTTKMTSHTKTTVVSETPDFDYKNKKFITFDCSFSSCSCNDFSLPPQLLKKFIDMDLLHVFYTEKINKNLSVFYVSTDNDFYSFLNSTKGVTYDKAHSSNAINFFSSDSK